MIETICEQTLNAYSAKPILIKEDFGGEEVALAGGYGYRQVLELIQNGADAILEAVEGGSDPGNPPLIEVKLTDTHLSVANTGAPFSFEGVQALLGSHISTKKSIQIGRFGMGFKSLLKLGGPVDITSANIAFRMDQERCRRELMQKFQVQQAPGFRLAWPIESADSLRCQFPWATTIIQAEIKSDEIREHLKEEIQKFPKEFLLFLPCSVEILLNDHTSRTNRRLSRQKTSDGKIVLKTEDSSTVWTVVERTIQIPEGVARKDATSIHARDEVALAWAVELESKRMEAGSFWTFFPTTVPSHVPGILNAPWKINSDRNGIIEGEWNRLLMGEAAQLIVETIPSLSNVEDPGRIIDFFPRQLDRQDSLARPLVEAVWARLEDAAVIPDGNGKLRFAKDLYRHPLQSLEVVDRWKEIASDESLSETVHLSCIDKDRLSRLDVLSQRIHTHESQETIHPNLKKKDVIAWFSAIASTDEETAIKVFECSLVFKNYCTGESWNSFKDRLSIIPSSDGEFLRPKEAFIAPSGTVIPGHSNVATWIWEDEQAKKLLHALFGIKPLNDDEWSAILKNAFPVPRYWGHTPYDFEWEKFWGVLRKAPQKAQNLFIEAQKDSILIRRKDRNWVKSSEVILTGELIDEKDVSKNQDYLVDHNLHKEDTLILSKLGVSEFPKGECSLEDHKLLQEWLIHWREHYHFYVNQSAKKEYLVPKDLMMPEAWKFLIYLEGPPNARLSQWFLLEISKNTIPRIIRFGHKTKADVYPNIDTPHPLFWLLLKYGSILIGNRVISISVIVSRLQEPALSLITLWDDLHYPLTLLKESIPIVEPLDADVVILWEALIEDVHQNPREQPLLPLWQGAAKDGIVPKFLGKTEIFVSSSPDLVRLATSQELIAFLLDPETMKLWLTKGANNLSDHIHPQWIERTGPTQLLTNVIPELVDVLQDDCESQPYCLTVTSLKLAVRDQITDVPCMLHDGLLLLDMAKLSLLSRAARLKRIVEEISTEGWLNSSVDKAIEILGDSNVEERRRFVSLGSSLEERLLRAVGKRSDPLKDSLGELGKTEFVSQCDPIQLSRLVITHYGPSTLSVLKDTLSEEGLKPPRNWGSIEAQSFVNQIGFPQDFATSSKSRRDAFETISGPLYLPQLHDYQQEVLDDVQSLLASDVKCKRAVISLPTGGGKTRVTVEAAVKLILAPKRSQRMVLWVAQSDELCEQAVQAFKQVWINLGETGTDLQVFRFWGGHKNPIIQDPQKPVVIIASIQTFNSRLDSISSEIQTKLGMVVIDECHHAITSSYTNLLKFLEADENPNDLNREDPMVLGLSATPFRADDEESKRLALRFNKTWFPSKQEELHKLLRSQNVLSEVFTQRIESGSELLQTELIGLQDFWEHREGGIEFQNKVDAINDRLSQDKLRNNRIIDRIKEADESAILLFANSVLHAEEMAARLNLGDIPAAAISGKTSASARRFFLEQFKRGEIRVLCNHTVLSTGFDAPMTDLIIISRLVFSRVRYMQMVGRGMRGEKNGGTSKCKIVTLMDNLREFDGHHPYHYCQRYFTDSR